MWVFLILAAAPLLYYYLTWTHDYWKKLGIPFIKPLPIFGSVRPLVLLQQAPGVFMGSLYNAPESLKQRFVGMFLFNSEPALLVRDPELLKAMYVKDFSHFKNRNVWCDPSYDTLGHNNLFTLRDEKWKFVRQKLTPVFTSGKIKQMFYIIEGIADELLINIENRITRGEKEIETKELTAKYTTDVISSCAFGIKSNSLNDPKSLFREFGRMVFEMTMSRALELRSLFFMHSIGRFTKAVFFSKRSGDFFRQIFWDAIDSREKKKDVRNDFLDTLIALKNDSKNDSENVPFRFAGDPLVAQSALFFVAGFETTATTISFALTELATAQNIQDKLREEILANLAAHGNKLTYEGIFEMKYLDKVVSETLRKYPPMPFIDRICNEDYKIPDSDLVIRKGTPVFTSLYNGLHYDPEFWPDPQKFDPERFSEENKAKRHPFAYIPFGEGPHICIGMRFGLMSVKTALSRLLIKYRIETSSEIKFPLQIGNHAFLLATKGGLPLKFIPLKN